MNYLHIYFYPTYMNKKKSWTPLFTYDVCVSRCLPTGACETWRQQSSNNAATGGGLVLRCDFPSPTLTYCLEHVGGRRYCRSLPCAVGNQECSKPKLLCNPMWYSSRLIYRKLPSPGDRKNVIKCESTIKLHIRIRVYLSLKILVYEKRRYFEIQHVFIITSGSFDTL